MEDHIIDGYRLHICTIKTTTNPFKVGDVISLEMFPLKKDCNKIDILHLKKIKLIEENKYLNIFNETMSSDDELIIEHFCEVI